jgi:polysaccharide pyruvyl transferase WcaK-like protein
MAPPGEAAFACMKLGGRDFFRAVLLGGGTLINPFYLRKARLARAFGASLCTVGTGVGSPGFGTPLQPSLAGWCELLRDSPVSVRGPLSRQALHEAGLKDVVVIGDPALGLTPDAPPEFRTRRRLIVNLARQPGASLSPAESAALGRVGAIAGEFLRDGGEVVGVALGNGDRALLSEFRAEYHLRAMTVENHRTSGERLLRTMMGSIGLIGVRLHSAGLASCLGVPSILLAYRDKCEDFMASMDRDEFALPLASDTSTHRKALFWKQRQRLYYSELAARFALSEGLHSAITSA